MCSLIHSISFCLVISLVTTYGGTDACSDLRIGAFNIQVFGKTKISKPHVVDVLERIVKRYDLLFVQEIRDASGDAILTLANLVNSSSRPYGLEISHRLGRTTSKEQYAYLYRQDKLQVKTAFVYNDSASDVFEREPLVVEFVGSGEYKSCIRPFSVIGVHVQPSNVAVELSGLVTVYNHSVARLGNTNCILMGDFNADCSYLPKKTLPSVQLLTDTRFTWLIKDDVDTTVAASDCAYDRLVVAGNWLPGGVVGGSVGVFRFDTEYGLNTSVAGEVSDHYPVEMDLSINNTRTTTGQEVHVTLPSQCPSGFKLQETATATPASTSVCTPLLVGAFNIQVFGKTKISKPHVVDVLERIVKRYDLLFVQEIRDASGDAILTLANLVNSSSRPYGLEISHRLGRTTSKEQYAYLYRQDKLQVKTAFVYNDSASDVFEREPLVVEFVGSGEYKSCIRPFSIIGVHVQPSNVAVELSGLVTVYNHSVARLGNTNCILMGDFNADCSYLPKKTLPSVQLLTDTRFTWLIKDDVDTTVAASDCAYDRLVVAGNWLPGGVVGGSVGVFRFDTEYGLNTSVAGEVSDHYPVEMNLTNGRPMSQSAPPMCVPISTTLGHAISTMSSQAISTTLGQAISTTPGQAISVTSSSISCTERFKWRLLLSSLFFRLMIRAMASAP